MLQFEKSWRFTSPGPAPRGVVHAFYAFIEKIAPQGDAWSIVEKFKYAFSGGVSRSSSLSWAWSDLNDFMNRAADNAPLFIEAFWTTCAELENAGFAVPDVALVNRALAEHASGFELRPPLLVATTSYTPVAVPRQPPSLASQARALIEESLQTADRLLDEGQGRRAVQELLWLLETISTAFRAGASDNSVQGKYFNVIVKEMRAKGRGTAQEQILTWMTTLHGYLSSPTGGGIRHGTDLQAGIAIQPHEARLYCNLIRSYLVYMIQEHERQAVAAVA